MSDDETCVCGHVYDEHDEDDDLKCDVEGCGCLGFEADDEAALS